MRITASRGDLAPPARSVVAARRSTATPATAGSHGVAVLVVHGMGTQADDSFATGFIAKVRDRLADAQIRPGDVVIQTAMWADVLNDTEQALYQRLAAGRSLDWRRLREFVISHLGDALAYQRVPPDEGGPADVYTTIHLRMREALASLAIAAGPDAPLVVIAHSLGGTIISNYIWDQQHPDRKPVLGRTPFERAETIAGVITFGCNLPLFTLCLPSVEAIAFPGAAVPGHLVTRARWRNYYDADDVLGWPLAGLGPSFRFVEDVEINVGNALTMWNPASHSAYWGDGGLHKAVARQLRELLQGI